MKGAKAKLLNKSFVTNQDLIEGIRNHSFVSARQHTPRIHTQKSQISLIKKKSFERLHTEKENISFISNAPNIQSQAGSLSDRAIVLLQDCLMILGEHNQKIQHKLKKVLGYVREMVEQKRKREGRMIVECQQIRANYQKIIEKEKQQCIKLTRSNQELKAKLGEYREKILSLRREVGGIGDKDKDKEVPSGLHQIIINQSQIIDQQCDQYQQQSNEMKRMLKVQALKIQEMLGVTNQKSELKQYTSLGSSFLLKR